MAIFEAAKNGNVTELETLLSFGDVNMLNANGETPLMICCEGNGKTNEVNHAFINPESSSSSSSSSTYHSSKTSTSNTDDQIYSTKFRSKNFSAAKLLIEKYGADVNKVDKNGWNSLMNALLNSHEDIVRLLIIHGSDVNYQRKQSGYTPLFLAIQEGHDSIVEFLVASGADCTYKRPQSGFSCLLLAIQDGKAVMVDLFLRHGADPNYIREPSKTTPLILAVELGHTAIVRNLIAYNASVNYTRSTTGFTPLFKAIQEGYLEICRVLVDSGANERYIRPQTNLSCLGMSAYNDHPDIFEYFFTTRSLTTFTVHDRIDVLIFAAAQNNSPLIDLILEQDRLLIDKPNNVGKTAYVVANERGQIDAQFALLRNGASPFEHHKFNRTFVALDRYLDGQTRSNQRSSRLRVQDVKDFRQEINVAKGDPFERTVLFVAARLQRMEWLSLFIEHGGDISYQDSHGWTPLHEAAFAGAHKSVSLLLEKGADVNALNFSGETPLCLALKQSRSFAFLKRLTAHEQYYLDPRSSRADNLPTIIKSSHPELDQLLKLRQNANFSAVTSQLRQAGAHSRTSIWWNSTLPSSLIFFHFLLLFGIFFPPLLTLGLLTSSTGTLSRLLITMNSLLKNTSKSILLLASTIYICLLISPPLIRPYLMNHPWLLGIHTFIIISASLGFLALFGWRARTEPRMYQLKHVSTDLHLLPTRVRRVNRKTRLRVRQEKYEKIRQVVFNWISLALIFLEFAQLTGFAFLALPSSSSSSFPSSPSPWPATNPFPSLFKMSILFLEPWLFSFVKAWAFFFGLVWFVYASYLGASLFILRSGHFIPNQPDSAQPPLRKLFRHITPAFYTSSFLSYFFVPLVSNGTLVFVLGVLFRVLSCTFSYEVLSHVNKATGSLCLQDDHLFDYTLSTFLLLFYVPTSCFIGMYYLESELQVKWIGNFISLERVVKLTTICAVLYFGNWSPSIAIGSVLFGSLVLLRATIKLLPCQNLRVVNLLRTSLLIASSWNIFCILLSYLFSRPGPYDDINNDGSINIFSASDIYHHLISWFAYWPFTLMVIGWIIILIFFFAIYLKFEQDFPFIRTDTEEESQERQSDLITLIQSRSINQQISSSEAESRPAQHRIKDLKRVVTPTSASSTTSSNNPQSINSSNISPTSFSTVPDFLTTRL